MRSKACRFQNPFKRRNMELILLFSIISPCFNSSRFIASGTKTSVYINSIYYQKLNSTFFCFLFLRAFSPMFFTPFFSLCFGFICSMLYMVFDRKREINWVLKPLKNRYKGVRFIFAV